MNVGGHFSKGLGTRKDSGYYPILSSSTKNLRPFLQKARIPDSESSRDPQLRVNLVSDPSPTAKIPEAYKRQVHTALLQSGAGLGQEAKSNQIRFIRDKSNPIGFRVHVFDPFPGCVWQKQSGQNCEVSCNQHESLKPY